MENRYRRAVLGAIVGTGYDIVEEDWDGFIVCKGDDSYVFVEPQVHIGEIDQEVEVEHSRFDFEKASCSFFANNDVDADAGILFSVGQLFVLNKDRGMFRHVIDIANKLDVKFK